MILAVLSLVLIVSTINVAIAYQAWKQLRRLKTATHDRH